MIVKKHKTGLEERIPASKRELAWILSRNLIPAMSELAVAIRKVEKRVTEGEVGIKTSGSILPKEFIIERKMKLIERFGKGMAISTDEPNHKKARRKKQ